MRWPGFVEVAGVTSTTTPVISSAPCESATATLCPVRAMGGTISRTGSGGGTWELNGSTVINCSLTARLGKRVNAFAHAARLSRPFDPPRRLSGHHANRRYSGAYSCPARRPRAARCRFGVALPGEHQATRRAGETQYGEVSSRLLLSA